MNATQLFREQIRNAHEWLEGTMEGVNDEAAHWQPGGKAHPIGTCYAHLVVSEDMMINGILKGEAPLLATTWAGKTGLEDPQAAMYNSLEWAQNAKVDLESLHRYAEGVYASTEAYLSTLQETDLERSLDLTEQGMGTWSQGAFILNFIFGHTHQMMGEISALKGLQSLKGYPF